MSWLLLRLCGAGLVLTAAACSGGSGPQAETSYKPLAKIVLTAAQQSAISAEVQACWKEDIPAHTTPGTSVLLKIIVDVTGTVELAEIAPADQKRVIADPVLLRFALHAVRAMLDRRCATLPLPDSLRGTPHSLLYRFNA